MDPSIFYLLAYGDCCSLQDLRRLAIRDAWKMLFIIKIILIEEKAKRPRFHTYLRQVYS